MKNSYRVTVNGTDYHIDIMQQPSGLYELILDRQRYLVDLCSLGSSHYNLLIDDHPVEVDLVPSADGRYQIEIGGALFNLQLFDQLQAQSRPFISSSSTTAVASPMPANVWKIHKQEGDPVEVGEQLLTLEAMKMESEVNAPTAGVLSRWLVAPGDSVMAHQLLCEINPSE